MQIFEVLEYHLRILGILKFHLPAFLRKYPINTIHTILGTILLLFVIAPLTLFVIFETKSFAELTEPFAFLGGLDLLLSLYCVLLWKKANLGHLIGLLKDIVDKSEF